VYSFFIVPLMTALLGLVMIFAAEPIIKVFVIALGIYLVVSGFYTVLYMLKLVEDRSYKICLAVRGALSIILGIFCIVLPAAAAEFAWKTMITVLAIYALCSVGFEIYAVKILSEAGRDVKRYVIEILITVAVAILLFMLLTSVGFNIIKIGGAVLIVIAIVLAISGWRNRDIVQADAKVVDEE